MNPAPLHPAEHAAHDARRVLGLSVEQRLPDLLVLVEEGLRLPVMIDRFGQEDVAGVLLQRADGEAFIGVNADFAAPRQRFTLAHEVGHVRLGHQPRVDAATDVFGRGRDPQEVAANHFAAEFVAPRRAVLAWLEEADRLGAAAEPETVAMLALTFGLSFPAMCFRLKRAGLVSQNATDRLVDELAQHGAQLARRFGEHRLRDTIEDLWRFGRYPRPPRETIDRARRAHDAGLLDANELAAIVPAAEDDYPYDAWTA